MLKTKQVNSMKVLMVPMSISSWSNKTQEFCCFLGVIYAWGESLKRLLGNAFSRIIMNYAIQEWSVDADCLSLCYKSSLFEKREDIYYTLY